MSFSFISFLLILFLAGSHEQSNEENIELHVVSYEEFEAFVNATSYVTDAETYGWSFLQKDVYNFEIVEGANWRKPDGENTPSSKYLPVTQVSYNDAIAYCEWSDTELPTYEKYWELIKSDKRTIVTNDKPITTVNEANVLGNVWEITATTIGDSTRLAGGSLFCSVNTCHGTSKDRKQFIDKQTGNIHIGFAVIRSSQHCNKE